MDRVNKSNRWIMVVLFCAFGLIVRRAVCVVPFGTPENVAAVNSGSSEGTPYLTLDGLSLYFYRGGGSSGRIYASTRNSLTAPFGPPTLTHLNNLDFSRREWPGSLSKDGLTIYLHSDPLDGGTINSQIYYATRPNTASDFSVPQLLPNVNSPVQDVCPKISADGLSLYFVSAREPTKPIWVARRTSTAEGFGDPTDDEFAQIHSYFDLDMVVCGIGGLSISPDERTLYFTVEDWAHQVPGRALWVARRPAKTGPFGMPTRDEFVNIHAGGAVEAPSVSADGSEIFFTSGRSGGQGSDDIWRATRPLPATSRWPL